jgi:archaetidylinositol phosphate synthase
MRQHCETLLDKLRGRLAVLFAALGKAAASVGVSPNAWTFVGLLVSFLAAVSFWSSGYRGELLGGLLILASGFLDVVDGAVARVTGRMSKQGAFLDSTLDRVAEVAIYLGILTGGLANAALVLLALSFSLLVSYTRARGEALGASLAGVGIGERSERLLVLAIASILGLTYYGVVLVAIIAGFTFLQRTYSASRSLAPRGPDAGATSQV